MRAMDWSSTPVGPVETWPQRLATLVTTSLRSRFPIVLWWGQQHYTTFYNDDYIPVLGKTKHPGWLGRSGKECWHEIWPTIGPMLEGVFATGQPTWSEDLLLVLDRNLPREETYFTFSYSAIPGESGGVDGIFCACTETSERVLGERRLRTLRDLASRASEARSAEEACEIAATLLEQNTADIPFALIYLLNPDRTVARLAAHSNIPPESQAAVQTIPIGPASSTGLWPLAVAARQTKPLLVSLSREKFGTLPGGPWPESPDSALVLPLQEPGQHQVTGFLVVGVNPRRVLDEAYQDFFTLVAGHVGTAVANARAYEEERRRAEVLAELDRAKTTFFSNVSHEFRTPLTLMLGPLEDLLAGDALEPRIHEQLTVIQRNGLRLLKLVNTLLDFSRIEAGRMQAVYAPTDLAALTADLASVFRSLVEKAGLRLLVDCQELSEPVYVDREMWEKIVLNLLSNAFKFTFAGEIAVSLRQVGQQAQLTVRDTGAGIAPEEIPRLFERFHRVQGARSRTHEGSGIGLALVQELVHLHGGTIKVESQPDVGTTFTITVPLGTAHLMADHIQPGQVLASTALGAAPFIEEAQRWLPTGALSDGLAHDWLEPASPSSLSFPLKEPQQRPARILLADDNADMRDYLSRLLRARYEVEAVGDGEAALLAARSRPPDLILSDVMMPGLDGFGLLRELRADPRARAVPVILLSARAGEESTIEGLEAGASDYLIKPFSAREVLARVAAHLEIARIRQEVNARVGELEAVFEAMTAGIDIVDTSGAITHMNQAGYYLVGLRSQEEAPIYFDKTPQARSQMLAMRDEQGQPLPPERAPAARVVRGEILAGKSAMDVQVHTLDGREREWEFSGAPTRDGAGNINGGVVMFHDVTERRALERRTAESLAALLEMAQTLVQGVGSDTQETEADKGVLTRIARLIQQAMGGQYTAATLVTPETGELQPLMVAGLSPEVEARWWSGLKSGKVVDFITPDMAERLYAGEVLTFDFAGQPPIPGQDYFELQQALAAAIWINPRQVCLLGVEIRNRPAFTQAEKDLAQAAVRLIALVLERDRLLRERETARARALASEETARRMDEFLGIASHELRTPMTSLLANLQLAERASQQWQKETLPEALRSNVERYQGVLVRSRRQVLRLNRLVGDLLEVSRISAGKLELRREPCELGAILREALEAHQAAWTGRQITLEGSDLLPLELLADADRLGQVVTNYLTNALKYSAPDQPVRVSLQQEQDAIKVAVHDRGPGLTQEQQAHLFERFYRAPGIEQRSGSGVGLGLGLYISRTIIERHRGQVGVESEPGRGSTFWFTLPLHTEGQAASA
jgi:signal transduction histidine kinase/FixJ family two-component response regulator